MYVIWERIVIMKKSISKFWQIYTFSASLNTKQEVLGRTNRPLSFIRHGPHLKRRVQQSFYCCVCVRYRGNFSTEPLPSNDREIFTEPSPYLATIGGYTYRHTDWWEGFYNSAVEMDSGAVIYVPNFIKIGSGFQKLIGRIHTHTHTLTAKWSLKRTLFCQNKESRLKMSFRMPFVCMYVFYVCMCVWMPP
jgi:hypothetical protein